MGPINVETQRTLKEIFEEHYGEMPKTRFFLDVKFQVRDGALYQINECLTIDDLTNFKLKHIEFGVLSFCAENLKLFTISR